MEITIKTEIGIFTCVSLKSTEGNKSEFHLQGLLKNGEWIILTTFENKKQARKLLDEIFDDIKLKNKTFYTI